MIFYQITLALAFGLALLNRRAFPLVCVLAASWAASAALEAMGGTLYMLAPYVDAACFWGLFVHTMKDPTIENRRAIWCVVGMLAAHLVYGLLYHLSSRVGLIHGMYASIALAYMVSLNGLYLMAVAFLAGGSDVRRIVGTVLERAGMLFRHPAGRRYAREARAEKEAAG